MISNRKEESLEGPSTQTPSMRSADGPKCDMLNRYRVKIMKRYIPYRQQQWPRLWNPKWTRIWWFSWQWRGNHRWPRSWTRLWRKRRRALKFILFWKKTLLQMEERTARQHNIITQLPGPWPPVKIFGESPRMKKYGHFILPRTFWKRFWNGPTWKLKKLDTRGKHWTGFKTWISLK